MVSNKDKKKYLDLPIMLLGTNPVGKTSLMKTFNGNKFNENEEFTTVIGLIVKN